MEKPDWSQEIEFWTQNIAGNKPYLMIKGAGHRFDVHVEQFMANVDLYRRCRTVSILDVGCGPISSLGTKSDIFNINILGIDPLTHVYNKVLQDHDLCRPHPALQMGGEYMKILGANTFDLVFSRNAIDHSQDPQETLRNMLYVCKPGGAVQVKVWPYEGKQAGYTGLHQWDVFAEDGDVIFQGSEVRDNIRFSMKDTWGDELIIKQEFLAAPISKDQITFSIIKSNK